MRAPYGDIDDRVRAIALAMGMVPIQWTRAPSGFTFDTNGMFDAFHMPTTRLTDGNYQIGALLVVPLLVLIRWLSSRLSWATLQSWTGGQ